MQHARLFGILLGLLLITAGGVFVLMQPGGQSVKFDLGPAGTESSFLLAGAGFGEKGNEEEPEEFSEQQVAVNQIAVAPPADSNPQLPPLPAPAVQPASPDSRQSGPQGKINLNTANFEELQDITGVGPVFAQKIIDWRIANGLFYEIEDIEQVSGIGEATFEKMKSEITVGDVPPRPTPSPGPQVEEQPEEPSESVRQPPPSSQPLTSNVSFPVNINTAGLDDLQAITGIGPVLAQRIIDYREDVSLFYYPEDIKEVSGIGDATFEEMKDQITVGDVVPPPVPPPPQPSIPPVQESVAHIFYTSSYASSKLYYCDTDSAWENLSEKYLESYSSEEAVLAKYPEKTLHEPCK